MKNLSYSLFALLFVIMSLGACEKQAYAPIEKIKTNETPFEGKLVATSLSVNPNEPDTLTLEGAENENISWLVIPETHNIIKKEGNKLIVSFQKFGGYFVTATVNGKSFTSNPGCWDNGTYIKRSYDDINITMTPKYYRSKTGTADSISFAFSAELEMSKVCTNEGFNQLTDRTSNDIKMHFWYITQPVSHCIPSTSNDHPVVYFVYPLSADPAKRYKLNIDYPITIKKGATTYTGSVRFSENFMDITWNYTSGLTFSSKHVEVAIL
ncbi:MAG: hypothetical protein V4619_03890 [Bacteroidota bacterium]